MKKQALALILTGAVAMNVAACSSTGERKHHKSRETTSTTAEETTTTTEPTTQTTQAPDPTTIPQTTVQMIGNTEFELSDEYQYILPYTYSRTDYSTPDMWETRFVYEIGFTDQDGNPICDPVYNLATLLDYANVYVVGQYDEEDHMKYGLISLDGNFGTGLIYDGYYEVPGRSHDTPGYIYMSDYEDGILTVDYFDFEINTIIERQEITINPDNFSWFSDDMMISVEKIYNDQRAVISLFESSWGPVGSYLIDTETGDILAGSEDWNGPILTDSMFIAAGYNEPLEIYDIDGNDITGDYTAAVDLNADKVALFTNDRVDVVDDEGNVTATTSIAGFTEADASNGKILVGTTTGIDIYDQDLNLITSTPIYYLSNGFAIDDRNNFTDGDVVFLDFVTEKLVNLMTGATVNYNMELTYTGSEGLIFAYDDWGTFYTVYGYDLENVTAGVGEAELIRDRATGELYIVEANDSDITKLYHVNGTDVEMLYQYSGYITTYSCNITGGILTGTCVSSLSDGAKDVVIGSDGNVIFECPLIDQ